MPSTYEKDDRVRTSTTNIVSRDALGSSSSSSTVAYNGTNRERVTSRSWTNTPNYRALKKNGSPLPVNNFTYYTHSCSGGGGVATRLFLYPNGSSVTKEFIWSPTGWAYVNPAFTNTSLDAKAKLRALTKAKGSEWDAPLFIKELPETVSMVANGARRIVLMSRALKQGRVGEFIQLAHSSIHKESFMGSRTVRRFNRSFGRDPKGAYANYWLEWSFGWSPFTKDVYDAVETLQDMLDIPEATFGRVRGTAFKSTVTTSEINIANFESRSYSVFCEETVKTVDSARCTWTFKPAPASIPARLGLTNPANLVWQALPLSFVVDWFLPIGDYLGALDTNLRFTTQRCSIGRRQQRDTMVSNSTRNINLTSVTGFSSVCNSVAIQRRAIAGPVPAASEFSFSFPTSISQATSAIALLKQRLK